MRKGADTVFGHEFCCEVLEGGGAFKAGDLVVSMPVLISPTGGATIGYSSDIPGAFAETILISEMLTLPVPNGLAPEHAALTEPLAVGEHAVAMGDPQADHVFLVIGCGPVGLAVIAGLKSRGYGPVAAADFSPARRKMAERMGADIVVDPAVESPHGKWSEMGVAATGLEQMMARMGGQTVKRAIIFECVGVPGVLQSLLDAAPNGAQIVVAGVCMTPDTIEPFIAITKQIDFRFVFGYTPEEFAATLGQIADGKIDVEPVITKAVGFDGVAAAFAALANPESQVKIVVEP
jgi:threonine dehydrogenase-like Zn-dependent dehydrogenase